ncbi:unnamed protein product [Ambrosiozyma monospora]|uniref:Unnamed protein product n=1 Tax=Ambrosiozyma monospora TaxID=43982 RepID=A0ACB5T9D5_AMBMO|nr:unnamed protein product [Ambrosiozyma monospora]
MRKDYILEVKSSSDKPFPELIYQNLPPKIQQIQQLQNQVFQDCSNSNGESSTNSSSTPIEKQNLQPTATQQQQSSTIATSAPTGNKQKQNSEKYVKFSIRNSNRSKTFSSTVVKVLVIIVMTSLVCFNISNLDPIQKILTKNQSILPQNQNNDPSSFSEAISQTRKLETHEIIIKILLAILKNIFYLICAIKITSC